MKGIGRIAGVLATLVVLAGLLPLGLRAWLWRGELNPVLRGRVLAERQGCHNCHHPDAGNEIPNAGSRWGSVPRFRAGNATMYGPSRGEIEEFIRFGAPRDWLDDQAVVERLETQLIRMPAYGERLADDEIDDLVEYVSAAEGVELRVREAAAEGRRIAREFGCVSCHGLEGSGGLPNPGSLGGFVPGFLGSNFVDLVEDREEFEEWVLEGTSARLARNPLIRHFWRRQRISMPAYEDLLEEEQIEALWVWVQALREEQAET